LLLSAQAVQISSQFRSPRFGAGAKAAGPLFGPESAIAGVSAFDIALIHPVPLRLTEALLELGPSRFPTLCDQLLIGSIEIGIVLNNRAIQTGALIDRRG